MYLCNILSFIFPCLVFYLTVSCIKFTVSLYRAVVLVAIDAGEFNFSDIRNVEYEMLKQNNDVKVIIRSTNQLLSTASLTEDRRLFV